MFCPNCGKELNLTGRFCEHCGYDMSKDLEAAAANESASQPASDFTSDTPVTEAMPSENAFTNGATTSGNAPVNETMPSGTVPKKQFNKKILIPIIAILAVIAIVLGGIVAYIFFVPKKVNLTDYVDKVTFEGFNSKGTATLKVNTDQLKKELAKKLKKPKASAFTEGTKDSDKIIDGLQGIFDKVTDNSVYAEILLDSVSFKVNPSSDLSNGDTVKLVIKYNNDIAKKFGIKFTKEEKSYTVKGLDELKEIDPFEGVSLNVDGVSPYLSVSITSNNSTFSDSDYVIDNKTDDYAKGDKVTVYVDNETLESAEDEYGYKFTSNSKEFTLDNVPTYVSSLSELSDADNKKLQNQAKDVIEAYLSQEADYFSASGLNYVGSYLLYSKKIGDESYSGDLSDCYCIFSAKVTNSGESKTVYFPVVFQNISKCGEDDVVYEECSDYIQGSSDVGDYTINGYLKIKKMYNELIGSYKASFTIDATDGLK